MNGPYSISNFFFLLLKTLLIASKLQFYIPESITLLNCVASNNSCSYWKKTAAIETTVVSFGDLEHRSSYVFSSFLCFAIPNLDLGILKMLIRVCFRDVLKPGVYWFVPGVTWLSASSYNKYTVFTVNICYLQVLALY